MNVTEGTILKKLQTVFTLSSSSSFLNPCMKGFFSFIASHFPCFSRPLVRLKLAVSSSLYVISPGRENERADEKGLKDDAVLFFSPPIFPLAPFMH